MKADSAARFEAWIKTLDLPPGVVGTMTRKFRSAIRSSVQSAMAAGSEKKAQHELRDR